MLVTRTKGTILPVDVEIFRSRHPLSKVNEPHLHDHVLILVYPLNQRTKLHHILLTYYAEFLLQIYDYELVRGLQKVGIAIEFQHPRRPQKWELAGFERGIIEAYSSRSMALNSTKRGTEFFDETDGKRVKGILESECIKWVDKPPVPEVIRTMQVEHFEAEIPPWPELFGKWEKRTELQLLGAVAGCNLGCGLTVDELFDLLYNRIDNSILYGTISRESSPSANDQAGVSVCKWEKYSPKKTTPSKSSDRRKPRTPLIWKSRDRDMMIVIAHGSFTVRSSCFQKWLRRLDPGVSCVLAPPEMGRREFETLGPVVQSSLRLPKETLLLTREMWVPLPPPGQRNQVDGIFFLPTRKCLGFKREKPWRIIAADEKKLTVERSRWKRTLSWLEVEMHEDKLVILKGWPLQIPAGFPCMAQVSRRKGGLIINQGDIVEPVGERDSDLLLADGRRLPPGFRIIEPAYWTRVLPSRASVETIITSAPPDNVNLSDWLGARCCSQLVLLTPRPDSLRTRIRGFLLEQQEKKEKARSRRGSSSGTGSRDLTLSKSSHHTPSGPALPMKLGADRAGQEVTDEIPLPSSPLQSITAPQSGENQTQNVKVDRVEISPLFGRPGAPAAIKKPLPKKKVIEKQDSG